MQITVFATFAVGGAARLALNKTRADPCACTGENAGVDATKYGADYGTSCAAHEKEQCAEWWGAEKTGEWCCQEWCYVSENCAGAEKSHLGSGLYYLYAGSKGSKCQTGTKAEKECKFERKTYPGGGVAVPNLNGKPCRAGFKKVTGPMGNKYCAPSSGDSMRGCVSVVDCEPHETCDGEGTEMGGICVTAGSKYAVHPHILDATCLGDADCFDGFVCRGPGPNGHKNCVLESDPDKTCVSPLDCPKGMSCKGQGYDADVAAGKKLPEGAICVDTPKYPTYVDTIVMDKDHFYVPKEPEHTGPR
mmetsp:Transcript_4600/g.10091  ORF Transcript_4600/g.10091 Transcript_4600/m.10091 type:complete len:304 (-) Transcript_4600:32-943(-)|eukprot:CAMPEP_0204273516 /NCGR_PEP_ID=MMETSP0468-20130131/23607_1 /ASSEMBLY_ACC=CAM_ASM_000383 /TAXON_ID=2969 /ORGANISM="Oxyrrhis marina" /LENGTH=303 /DNA_ID=CAMNT_0051249565 /DNA_START=76 /DNA_END=987 /DNA_ORIENTATION=+